MFEMKSSQAHNCDNNDDFGEKKRGSKGPPIIQQPNDRVFGTLTTKSSIYITRNYSRISMYLNVTVKENNC